MNRLGKMSQLATVLQFVTSRPADIQPSGTIVPGRERPSDTVQPMRPRVESARIQEPNGMDVSLNPTAVRQIVLDVFQQYQPEAADGGRLEEHIRIQEGRLAARCYRDQQLFAMWLVDVGLLQFYDQQGNMLRTINLLTRTESSRIAA